MKRTYIDDEELAATLRCDGAIISGDHTLSRTTHRR